MAGWGVSANAQQPQALRRSIEGIPGASDTSPKHSPEALTDGGLEPWGSAETTADTYFYVIRPSVIPRLVSVMVFSPEGRAHLRDVSVVAGLEQDGIITGWTVVPARLNPESEFGERLTVPLTPDHAVVDFELKPGFLSETRFNTFGLACLSKSRGDKRNWLKSGRGIYVRQLMFDRFDAITSALGTSMEGLWERVGLVESERRHLERNELLNTRQLADFCGECLGLDPPVPHILQKIAHHLYLIGDPEMSAALYLRAVEAVPRRDWHNNYLQAVYASPNTDNARMLAACAGYSRRHFHNPATMPGGLPNDPDPERRLRVGFLGYYFAFPIARTLLLPFLRALGRTGCEVFVYDDGTTPAGAMVAACANQVRNTQKLDDRELAQTLRDDGIDVAVEMVGHLSNNRFGALAFRPAPIQVIYYNWQATTGLPFIDYVFAHRSLVPAEDERYYLEKLLWPQHLLGGFAVPEGAPAVSSPPVLANGFVTVGSFCGGHKLTHQVLEVWAELLGRNPTWRLFLKNATLDDAGNRLRIMSHFARAGIDGGRITLRGHSEFVVMLDDYRELDIALDPWPFGGGTTMLWALCQGVPMVTMRGERFVSRVGAAILSQLGMDDLIAGGPEDYVQKVEALGARHDRLCQLRSWLRTGFVESFADVDTMARDWESAVRKAWHAWCASETRHGT